MLHTHCLPRAEAVQCRPHREWFQNPTPTVNASACRTFAPTRKRGCDMQHVLATLTLVNRQTMRGESVWYWEET
jgi:hypothetical protein